MTVDMQGQALSVLSKLAQADWPDRLKLRKPFERLVYSGSRASFRLAAGKTRTPRPAAADELFDLSLSDEQQMLVEMLQGFALDVLRPLAHEADAQARVPAALRSQAHELGLAHYG
ncbi:acyl-CoA dehydrogenase family protein, partial [Pseudomonas sp. EGD-AK9]|uniref:acyl-CoA dehydrogenase family protein n=1 Tax=Pseudomonas sp. EGD-AK9 TaxID=1386078 RepID=UPI0004CF8459